MIGGKTKREQQQEELERVMEGKLQEAKDNAQKEIDLQAAVRQLSHVPGRCPVSACKEIIFPTNLMMHMLHKHVHAKGVTSSELYEYKPQVICFDPLGYEYGKNSCMATFLYGGVEGEPKTQPGLSYLSYQNSALINDNHKYDNYLPIMMMVCRSTWYAQLKDKQLERELVSINADKAGIFVFWLVAPKTTRKLYYTLTVYDRYYLNSRSVVRVVRNYASCQNPSDFLPIEDNYMLLRDAEIDEFMLGAKSEESRFRTGIPLEIIVYENPEKEPVQHCSQKKLQEAQVQLQEQYIINDMPKTKGPVRRESMSKISKTTPESNQFSTDLCNN